MVSIDFSCDKNGCANHWPTEYSGCPECAGHYCQACAAGFDMICPCGGELQQDKYYELGGCCKLPEEIVQFKTLKERINALNEIRPRYHFIEAEYNAYKRIIVLCERDARINGAEVQDNLGYDRLSPASKGYLHYDEAIGILLAYAVPSNVEQLLSLVSDDYFMKEILKEIDAAPKTEAEWDEYIKNSEVVSIMGVINSSIKDAVIIPEDCNVKCSKSYRDSIELLRKHLHRE